MTDSVAPTRQDRDQRWTRPRVAERLGVSVASIRRLEGSVLHPVRDADGIWLFRFEEVEAVSQQRRGKVRRQAPDPGAIASRAFQMFEGGRNLREIVIELHVTPQAVRALYDEWLIGLDDGRVLRDTERQNREYERAMTALVSGSRASRPR